MAEKNTEIQHDAQANTESVAESEAVVNKESLAQLLPYSFVKSNKVIGIESTDDGYRLGVITKPSIALIVELKRHLGLALSFEILNEEDFDGYVRQYYGKGSKALAVAEDIGESMDLTKLSEEIPEALDLLESADDAPVIKLINALINQAVSDLASDIHFEAYEKKSVVRFRVDGILKDVLESKRELHSALVSRLKVMANLDIAEKRLPQDGRISIRIADHSIDIRLSTLPSQHGERVVLRLLDKTASRFDLQALGMTGDVLTKFSQVLNASHGIFLVTGPTGSGKTTSLYSGLAALDRKKLNILTVEDPVEYDLDGISQTQVNTKAGLTFASGLRSILRQDPDVILVGEIRDLETAEIAVQASLTGHLVLSTLHTNSAIGAITRLVDMGIEPFLISSTVLGVLSQRLMRTLCEHCAESYTATAAEKRDLNVSVKKRLTIKKAVGCSHCDHLGYKGRTGVYELIYFDSKLKTKVHDGHSEEELLAYARQHSASISDDAIRLVLAGKTSLEEVQRVISLA